MSPFPKESDLVLLPRNYTGRKTHRDRDRDKDQPCPIRVEFHLMYTEKGRAVGHREGRCQKLSLSSNIEATCNITPPEHKDKIAPEHSPASCTDISPIEYGTSNRHQQENLASRDGLDSHSQRLRV
jgi:hypothetical protein